MTQLSDLPRLAAGLPGIRHVTVAQPMRWLGAGWRDLKANLLPSLAYGLLFALGGDLIILAALAHPHLLTVAISGFFLVAPLLAAGLYELSRSHAAGERLLFIESLRCFRRNGQSLALFGMMLALAMLFWERVSAVAFALTALDTPAAASAYLYDLIFSGDHLAFTATWLGLVVILPILGHASWHAYRDLVE